MCSLGCDYINGVRVPRDVNRGISLMTKAADLGDIATCGLLGDVYNPELHNDYDNDNEAGKDLDKAMYYYGLAAKGGHQQARYNLGILSRNAGDANKSLKHLKIAAAQGHDEALTMIKKGYIEGSVTKDEFAKA